MMTIGLGLIGMAAANRNAGQLWNILWVCVVGFAATNPSLQSLLSLNVGDDEQGEMLGVGQSMSALARILGPIAGLSLQEYGLSHPYWMATIAMGVSVLMVTGLKSAYSATNPNPAKLGIGKEITV